MSIEYRVFCNETIPPAVREVFMERSDITRVEEMEDGMIAVRIRVKEEPTESEGPSFSCYLEEKQITIAVHSAVFYAHTRAAYLVLQAFMDSGISFQVEGI